MVPTRFFVAQTGPQRALHAAVEAVVATVEVRARDPPAGSDGVVHTTCELASPKDAGMSDVDAKVELSGMETTPGSESTLPVFETVAIRRPVAGPLATSGG